MKKRIQIIAKLFSLILLGFIVPQNFKMPVENATSADYNKASFWYYPWGKSGTHKGVDIFAKKGTKIHSSVKGLVLATGKQGAGGKYVLVIGPKWRVHYYAHLQTINTKRFKVVGHDSVIGTVGDSGNAVGKPPHLHYSIATIFPYPWRIDGSPQGWKKMFYLNPIDYLKQ